MSTIPVRTLRPEIKSVLHSLRTKIQIYLLFHGMALVLIALCVSFLGTLAFDWIQFQIRKLELPVAFRVVLAVAVLGGICWVLANWLVLRLLSSKKPHGLALILEKRFPDLNDRLITAVEFSDGREHYSHSPLSEAMVDHTVSSVATSTQDIELGDVFDWKPLVVSWVAAVVMLGGAAATVAASPQSFERWTRAFLYFDEVYWLRETKLDVLVLAEPGDRPRPFVDGVYLHPRGGELKLLVTVPDEERPMGGKWSTPDLVEIEYVFEQGRGGDSKILARRGDREFQFKMPSVLEGFEFWITGNDYINRTPYRIVLVDPPEAAPISLKCDYADYMGLRLRTINTFFQNLLQRQSAVYRETVALDKLSLQKERFIDNTQFRVITQTETEIYNDLDALKQEGLPNSLSDVVDQIMSDLEQLIGAEVEGNTGERKQIIGLLEEKKTGERTQKVELRIAESLNEAALILESMITEQENLDELLLIDDQFDIPLETSFELVIQTNKPLRNATIQAGPYEISLGQFSDRQNDVARLRKYDEGGGSDTAEMLPEAFLKTSLSEDRRTVALPFILSAHTPGELESRPPSQLAGKWAEQWILPPDSPVKIYLEDTDGVISAEPTRFVIRGQLDHPPVIESQMYGIGTAITKDASIPIKCSIEDDFGIAKAGFRFQVDGNEAIRTRQLENPPRYFPLNFNFYDRDEVLKPYEKFEVKRVGVVPGQKLTLTVFAEDADSLSGPHESASQEYTFRIVTPEELRALLTEREINLNRQFAQIIAEVERTRKDLMEHRVLYDELTALDTSDSARKEEIRIALVNCAERSLFQIGKNRAETATILASFKQILDELENNKIHDQKLVDALDEKIVQPLRDIVIGESEEGLPSAAAEDDSRYAPRGDFPTTDSEVGLFRQQMEQELDPTKHLDQSIAEVSLMLNKMRDVLSEMRDLQELHEAIAELQKIADDFKSIRQRTEEEKRNALKNKLNDL